MRILDFHQHLWVGATAGGMEAEGAKGFVEGMDRHQVERAVLHALPTSLYPHVGDNEAVLKAIREFPDRLVGSVYINPRDVARSLETLARYHGEGFRCVKLLPYVEGVYIDDPAYTPVFEKINELGLPVMIHMGLRGGLPKAPGVRIPFDFKCIHPMYLNNLSARFPNTRFVIAHFAFQLFWDALALHRMKNVYIEVSMNGPKSMAYQVLLDLEKQGPKDACRVMRLDNRIMFGLDLNAKDYGPYISAWQAFLEAIGKPQYRDAFFYQTAARVLGFMT